jgi:hypothetical protein
MATKKSSGKKLNSKSLPKVKPLKNAGHSGQ